MIPYEGKTAAELGFTHPQLEKNPDIRFYELRDVPEFRTYGLIPSADGKTYVRVPEHIVEPINPSITRESRVLSGGRIRFVTDSDFILLRGYGIMPRFHANMSQSGSSGFSVYMKRPARDVFVGVFTPPANNNGSFTGALYDTALPKNCRKEITIYTPLCNTFSDLYIGLDKNSTLEMHPDYKYERPVLFYGSSITHGISASHPGLAYPAIISRKLETNFINLGLSGNCKAEEPMIDYLCSFDPSVFVLDYDHNAPTPEYLAKTHEKLYLRFRAAHPDTPVVMVTKPDGTDDDPRRAERRDIVFNTYKNARERGEKVIFVDGYQLFGGDAHGDCTTDGCHPNDLGLMRMADTIGKAVEYAMWM